MVFLSGSETSKVRRMVSAYSSRQPSMWMMGSSRTLMEQLSGDVASSSASPLGTLAVQRNRLIEKVHRSLTPPKG